MNYKENDPFQHYFSSYKKRLKLKKIYTKTQILSKLEFPGSELKFRRASSFKELFYKNKIKLKKEEEEEESYNGESFLYNPIQNLTHEVIKNQATINKEIKIGTQILIKDHHNKYSQIIQDKHNIIKEISNIYNLLMTNIEKNHKIQQITQNYNEESSLINSSLNALLIKSQESKLDIERKETIIKTELDKLTKENLIKQEIIQNIKHEKEVSEVQMINLKRDFNLLEDYINNEINIKYDEIQTANRLLEEKRQKNYNTKMDYLLKTLVLKPFYRKFLVLRTGENYSKYKFKICKKNRKTFTIINSNNIEVKVNFDYIFSSFDSNFDYLDLTTEDEKIDTDLLRILSNYLGEISQHNIMSLYITQLNQKFIFDNKIVLILKKLITDYANDYICTIKIITKEESIEIVTDKVYKEEENFFKNLIGKNFKKELKLGFTLTLNSAKNKSRFTFIVTDHHNYSLINLILGKFNEENNVQTKKKKEKDKSFTKRKMKKDYNYFFEEIKQENTLYYSTFIEIEAEKVNLQDETLNDIFLNL